MKLCAVVIWYNPQNNKNIIDNLISYSHQCEKIFIIDNSNNNNSSLLENINNVEYIPLLENKGIATALNIGCSKALEEGFEWCMTMDQDSNWESDQLESFIQKISNKIVEDPTIASFAPYPKFPIVHSTLGKIRRKIFKNIKDPEIPAYDEYIERCICSGNIINLKAFEKVGKFYEPFFIDEVDHEFCFRLIVNGYKIYQFNSVILNHHLGDENESFFPTCQHSQIRNYYALRNMLYICKNYPEYAEKFNYESAIKFLKKMMLKYGGFNYFSNKKIIKKAYKDFNNNKFGKYIPE